MEVLPASANVKTQIFLLLFTSFRMYQNPRHTNGLSVNIPFSSAFLHCFGYHLRMDRKQHVQNSVNRLFALFRFTRVALPAVLICRDQNLICRNSSLIGY